MESTIASTVDVAFELHTLICTFETILQTKVFFFVASEMKKSDANA